MALYYIPCNAVPIEVTGGGSLACEYTNGAEILTNAELQAEFYVSSGLTIEQHALLGGAFLLVLASCYAARVIERAISTPT